MTDPREPSEPPEDRRLDAEVRAAYRQATHASDAARERVLSRLAAGPARERPARERTARDSLAPGVPGWLGWWFARRPVELRPAWVLAGLAAALLAGAGLGARLAGTIAPPREATPGAGAQATAAGSGSRVTFVLRAPGATRVSVVGDFNNWDAEATPMAHSGSGDLWILELELSHGVHQYSFVLDGSEWRPDPSAPLAADDPFGGHNSVIVVNGARGL